MKIAMSSGHGKYIRGASGYPVPPQLDEVDEARHLVDLVAEILNDMDGVECVTFHDNTSHDQSTNLATITNWHNAQVRDYDVSVHFNAFDGTAHGTEVLYVTQQSLAGRLSAAISEAGYFTNRGAKYRSDLYVLNNTEMPAVLLEICFCDNSSDSSSYTERLDYICTAIAETLSGQTVPIEPEEPDVPVSDEARVDIESRYRGDVTVIVNDVIVRGNRRGRNVVDLRVTATGPVTLCVNGEEFHNTSPEPEEEQAEPYFPENQSNIITTVFGGGSDPNYSAYGPYDANGRGAYIDDDVMGVALPWRFPDADRPQVRVVNPVTGQEVICEIVDVGPWLTDDEAYVMGDQRPLAETCYLNNEPLPRGPNQGKIPNGAGIDLTPAAAKAIGIEGKGVVHWAFVE